MAEAPLQPPVGGRPAMKPGFNYMIITINMIRDKKFGMLVKNVKSTELPMVVVSTITPGSMCAGIIKELDQIIEVNGQLVTDRDQCKELITISLRESRTVALFISRPNSPRAMDQMEQLMNASLMMPSVELRSDVRDIQRRFNAKLQVSPAGQKKGILMQPGTQAHANVRITESMTPHIIATDISCRLGQLQRVPVKQAPSPPPPSQEAPQPQQEPPPLQTVPQQMEQQPMEQTATPPPPPVEQVQQPHEIPKQEQPKPENPKFDPQFDKNLSKKETTPKFESKLKKKTATPSPGKKTKSRGEKKSNGSKEISKSVDE